MILQEEVFMYRAKNNLTQREFAKIARISEPTMVAFEAGKHVSHITEAKIKMIVNADYQKEGE